MRIFQMGYPGGMGGANTECWHTVRLWRDAGWEVHMIPTWACEEKWERRLDDIGVVTHHAKWGQLHEVEGLAGSIVVGMCNQHACRSLDQLRAIGCKLIWVNCMTFLEEWERQAFLRFGVADVFMFQSEFQRSCLEPLLRRYGYTPEQGLLVRGAFDCGEFPYEPLRHEPGGQFVVGRLSRPDRDKWSSNHWPIFESIPYNNTHSLNMGWMKRLEQKLGKPPEAATCLKPQEISSREFLARCHVLLQINGGARENWPRVGLEAMSAGVPIVAENRWGWPEMVEHGKTGFLCDTDADFAYYTAKLANEEGLRLEMADAARAHVERLSSSPPILGGWEKMIRYAETHEPRKGMVV